VTFDVVIVSTASREFGVIVEWIAERSSKGAARWVDEFERAVNALSEDPHRYALAPEAALLNRDVRQALFKTRRGRTYRVLVRGHGANGSDTSNSWSEPRPSRTGRLLKYRQSIDAIHLTLEKPKP